MSGFLRQMLDELTSAYTRKDLVNQRRGFAVETNIGKLFSLFAYGLEDVERQAELIRLWDDIDFAQGSVLDRYGMNFGVVRMSPDDAIYRLAIKVKMVSQLSGGDIDTVIFAACSLLNREVDEILLEERFPGNIDLYVDWEPLTDEHKRIIEDIAWAIKRILAASVGMRLYVRTYRTYVLNLPISRIAWQNTHIWSGFVPQDRTGRTEMPLNIAGAMFPRLECNPATLDRESKQTIGGSGGVACHKHLTSKFIS